MKSKTTITTETWETTVVTRTIVLRPAMHDCPPDVPVVVETETDTVAQQGIEEE